MLVARGSKEPPDKGGWNLFHTWWQAGDVVNPAVHFGVAGGGQRAYFGWPDIPQLERLVSEWVRAPAIKASESSWLSKCRRSLSARCHTCQRVNGCSQRLSQKNVRNILNFGALEGYLVSI